MAKKTAKKSKGVKKSKSAKRPETTVRKAVKKSAKGSVKRSIKKVAKNVAGKISAVKRMRKAVRKYAVERVLKGATEAVHNAANHRQQVMSAIASTGKIVADDARIALNTAAGVATVTAEAVGHAVSSLAEAVRHTPQKETSKRRKKA